MSWMDRWRRRSDATHPTREDEALHARARRLPREIEPERDLWLGIENQLRDSAQSRRKGLAVRKRRVPRLAVPRSLVVPGWVAVGMVGLLVATTIGSALFLTSGPSLDDPAQVRALADSLRDRDGVAYVRRDLRTLLDERGERLPPKVVAAVEANLVQIDRAIAEIHLAFENQPDSSTLQILLADAYRQEAEILDQLEWWTRDPADEARS